ncbi:MAG: hypothetical protein DWH82_03655 [Planctomycetota bacterium]|nr:MAG: hypothetical protein DWH82_03655 [Planctomycetota bacterium]
MAASFEVWFAAFDREYLRRTHITWAEAGAGEEKLRLYFYEGSTAQEAVLAEIEHFDLFDSTQEPWLQAYTK